MKEIVLYSAEGSNCSQRVEWVLNYKCIPYAKIDVESEGQWQTYLTINPLGYVPCLSIDGHFIAESMAIIETLEEGFPEPCLLGNTWQQRAQIRAMCEYINGSIHMPQNRSILKLLHPDITSTSKQNLRRAFLSRQLNSISKELFRNSDYVLHNDFSLADIFVASIYKKARQLGAEKIDCYHHHLQHLRQYEHIARSEPNLSKA